MYRIKVDRTFEAGHSNGPEGGKCYKHHGHSWRATVAVDVEDSSLDEYGWSIDYGIIKAAIDKYDHDNLNDLLEVPPSAENVAKAIWDDVHTAAKGKDLSIIVRIREGHGNSLEYYGPDNFENTTAVEIDGTQWTFTSSAHEQHVCICGDCKCGAKEEESA